MNGPPILSLSGIDFGYGQHQVFDGLDLDVEQGAMVLLKGPSGSGKSTLLRLVNRLEDPTAGSIRFLGRPLESFSPPRLRREACLLPQTPILLPGPVRDNLLVPFTFKANADLTLPDDATLRALMARLLLSDVDLDAPARALSVGQRQRLCLIRAVLVGPKLLLLDEPTSALDSTSKSLVEDMVEAMNLELGLTVIMAGHRSYRPKAALAINVTIQGGKAVAGDTP